MTPSGIYIRTEEHGFSGRKHSEETRLKMSESQRGRIHGPMSEETKKKLSEAKMGKKLGSHSEATKKKIGLANKDRKLGPLSDEHRQNVSKALKGRLFTEEHKRKISEGKKGGIITLETKQKISAGKQGISLDEWNGFVSFEPYCHLFNEQKKEEIRNQDERKCVLCGKSEIENGRRLSVHHIDGDKMQGCVGQRWYLCSLCLSCNTKRDTIEKEFLIVSNRRHYN